MPRRQKTGFDKFFDEQMKSPSFAESYREARAKVGAFDREFGQAAVPALRSGERTVADNRPTGRGRAAPVDAEQSSANRPNRPQKGSIRPTILR